MALVPGSIPEQRSYNGRAFPLVLTPDGLDTAAAACDYVRTHRADMETQLQQHGAILFRGLPLATAADFNDFVLAFGRDELPYLGGAAPRTNVVGRVFTSNESPPSEPIPFHHEMAQVRVNPRVLWFFSEVPAASGGETPICLSNELYERLVAKHPEFVRNVAEKGACRFGAEAERMDRWLICCGVGGRVAVHSRDWRGRRQGVSSRPWLAEHVPHQRQASGGGACALSGRGCRVAT
jgi:hypothetical protein